MPDGWLPVFSVDTEEDAKSLIVLTCPTDREGNYYARELVHEQTLDNLQRFSDKLQEAYVILMKRKGRKP